VPVPANAAGGDALLAAFLEGAGMQDAEFKDPAATMRGLGRTFRDMVAGLRAVLIGRAQGRIPHRADDDPGAWQQSAEVFRR
jgi:type VI secretion system protein ImpI/type VI secretion system protein